MYNTVRPHSSLGYQPPAPEAVQSWSFRYVALREKTMIDSAEN
jgi:transposase InsO family protein